MSTNETIPSQTNFENKKRHVGFELEFAGINVEDTAKVVKSVYGGTIKKEHKNLCYVKNTSLGNFIIEVDARILKSLAKSSRNNIEKNNIDVGGLFENLVSSSLKNAVPVEIVFPPVSINQLKQCDCLVEPLRQAGAVGTKKNLIAGFGVHINPEVPSIDSASILSYIQSFILLEPWLRSRIKVDFTRKIMPFIKSYPKKYKKLVLNKHYNPNINQLINDYIDANPTRNCGLDMLPLFSYIDESTIKNRLSSKLIKKRPTFHYRLPNCDINNSNWSLMSEWEYWVVLERLANNNTLRSVMAVSYLEQDSFLSDLFDDNWLQKIEPILREL